ncbi:hypothetical protein CF15_00475 [Pyrodictium occultum]|uniref:Uncharacterized protein n=1 Tax=Pyrodictium occultum TaxID=2309 RepID=A0A0V8RTG0_PYROC|nr:hypothetical protein [Pyrodictium occultum]KSW11376.1 hypothetical protein CF15_00475 [Pyrodictium occultum]
MGEPEFLIVYHEPGDPSEHRRVQELAARIRELAGVELEAIPLREFKRCSRCRRVYLLMFTRGGHWLSLREKGVNAAHIPPSVTAAAVAEELERRGLDRVMLVALKARRLVRGQSEDLELIARLLQARGLRAEARILDSLEPPERPETREPVAPVALLAGRLVRAACMLTKGPCLGPFIDYGWWHLLAWITSDIRAGLGENPGGPRRAPRG